MLSVVWQQPAPVADLGWPYNAPLYTCLLVTQSFLQNIWVPKSRKYPKTPPTVGSAVKIGPGKGVRLERQGILGRGGDAEEGSRKL